MTEKIFLKPDEYFNLCFELAHKVYSNFTPDLVVGIWRGGSIPGIIIHEYLKFKGLKTEHSVIKCHSYVGMKQQDVVELELFPELKNKIKSYKKVLFVDDVFDSGKTIEKIRSEFGNVKIATVIYKDLTDKEPPDFFVMKTKKWIVFPHELVGLEEKEISEKGLNIKL